MMRRNPDFTETVINKGILRICKKYNLPTVDNHGESLKAKLLLFYQKYPAAKTCMIETKDNIIYYHGSRIKPVEVTNIKQLAAMNLEAIDKTFSMRVPS